MKSWAVPKGPSRDPAQKRLAVHVEDHPIDYNRFEGTIPKGEYGGGTVMIWDRGTYEPEDGDPETMRRGLEKGRISFTLHGKRLRGAWTLVRTGGKDSTNWLLIKRRDDHVVPDDDQPERDLRSVASGKTMRQIAGGSPSRTRGNDKKAAASRRSRTTSAGRTRKSASTRSRTAGRSSTSTGNRSESAGRGRRRDPPATPMLATLGSELPPDDGWAFEPKYDGIRVLAYVTGDAVRLITRNGNDKSKQFPEVVDALRALARRRRRSFVLDGEIVARRGTGLGRFQALQERIAEQNPSVIAQHVREAPAVLVAFDVLLDGDDGLTGEPWTERRRRLERLLAGKLEPGLQLGDAQMGGGARLLRRARAKGWEGIIAKRSDSRYVPGKRTREWLKLKVESRQEFVVGGWTEPRLSREHLGALLVGYYEGDRFIYAGHVGGGFTRQALADMYRRLLPLERKTSPFETEPHSNEPAHWVTPKVVVEVKFSEWTSDGRLRQPIFVGVRDDKDPRTVTREPESVQHTHRTANPAAPMRASGNSSVNKRRATVRSAARRNPRGLTRTSSRALAAVLQALDAIEAKGGEGTIDLPEGTSLRVTSLDKIYFPRDNVTKGDVLRYYVRVSPALLPLMADRPLVLHRFPEGIEGEAFFQQTAPADLPPGVRAEEVPTDDGPERRFVGGNLATLLYCVQIGTIAVNPWHSRIGSLHCPDYTILDLDPGPKTSFASIVRVARWLEGLLRAAKVNAGLKTSGSRGLHIVIPLPPNTNEEAAQLVAHVFAERVAREHPREATVERMRRKRPDDAVYVDYLQNIVGKSVASAFSLRAKPGATVSTPLAWRELTDELDPAAFTISTVPDELATRARIWHTMLKTGNSLRSLLAERAQATG